MSMLKGVSKQSTIIDVVSGQPVTATPEEVEAVQPMLMELLNQLGYEKEQLQSHPQYTISKSPSDSKGTYPLDIAVFEKDTRTLRMIIECKKNSEKTKGITQLHKYMYLCDAKVGVWTNGKDRRIFVRQGNTLIDYPAIPCTNTDIAKIGTSIKRKDLVKHAHLAQIFIAIRNYLGSSAMPTLVVEDIINLILCKIWDERNTKQNDEVSFYAPVNESDKSIGTRITTLFESVKNNYADIYSKKDKINLTATEIAFCVRAMQEYDITNSSRDAIAEAFQVFIGVSLRGDKGQFFTPKNLTNFAVKLLNPKHTENICDPSCGSGGFLISALEHVWADLEKQQTDMGWDDALLSSMKAQTAQNRFFGIDKEPLLTKITKAYMAIMGDGKAGIFCDDTLKDTSDYEDKTKARFEDVKFNVVLANPPYGKEIKVDDVSILSKYDLAHKYDDKLNKLDKLEDSCTPQILFIEKIINMLDDGGRAGIVLPLSLFSNVNDKYLVKYIMDKCKILGLIELPSTTFKISGTDVKTCILFIKKCNKQSSTPYDIFMGVCNEIGHNQRGKATGIDDLDMIYLRWLEFSTPSTTPFVSDQSTFVIKSSDVVNYVLTPHYYREAEKNKALYANHNWIDFATLIKEGILYIEVGGRGNIKQKDYTASGVPYLRTTDIENMEVSRIPARHISQARYNQITKKNTLAPSDILFVRAGRSDTDNSNGRIGDSAWVFDGQEVAALYGALAILRIVKPNNQYNLTQEALFWLINESVIKNQIRQLSKIEGALSSLSESSLQSIKIRLPAQLEMAQIHKKMSDILNHKDSVRTILSGLK